VMMTQDDDVWEEEWDRNTEKSRSFSVCGQLKDNPKGRRRRMREIKGKPKIWCFLRLRSSLPKTHSALAAFCCFFSLAYSSDTLDATHCFESSLPCLLKTTIMFETRLLRVSPKKS
jgi:hypothetical protein